MTRLVTLVAFAALVVGPHAAAQRVAAQRVAPAMVSEPARAEAPAWASAGTFEYLYDDGAANVNIGPPSTFDPDMLWGNYFFTDPAGVEITEISVAFGPTFPSSSTGPVTFWLLDDPDGDGDPRTNAEVLRSVDATPDVFGNTFYHVPIDPVAVSGAGFFVGASAQLLGGQDRPARVDTDGRADRSWFFYAPDIAAVIDSLAGAPFGTRMDDPVNVPFPGAFMIRATGQPVVAAADNPAGGAVGISATPNPVVRETTIRFELRTASKARLEIFDPLGRRVTTLAAGDLAAGAHALRWETRGYARGVYVARLSAGADMRTVRLVVSP